jgi:hypothetical protein
MQVSSVNKTAGKMPRAAFLAPLIVTEPVSLVGPLTIYFSKNKRPLHLLL